LEHIESAKAPIPENGCTRQSTDDALPPRVADMIRDNVEWSQVQRDFVHLVDLLYGIAVRSMSGQTDVREAFVAEFQQKLVEMPEGWRIARLLRDRDAQWGHQLECKGLQLDHLSRGG